MRNRFPGVCYRCNQPCAAGDGHFEKMGRSWRVQHAACAIEHRGSADPERAAYARRKTEWLATQTGRKGNRARKRLRELNEAANA